MRRIVAAAHPTARNAQGIQRWLSLAVLAASVGFICLFAYTALDRLTFPFDLEWEEGAVVDHVSRLLHGQHLYVPPSLDFIPFVYTPGYYYVAAAAAKVLGASVMTLRFVSILCSFGLFWILMIFGRRERGSTADGVVLAGMFAATYAIGGSWFDIARVDSLFLLLTIAALYLLRFGETAWAMAGAGLLLAGALLTKQVALIVAPPLLLYAVMRLGRRGLIAGAVFLSVTLVAAALLEWLNDGWFLYYVYYTLTKTQAVFANRALTFWTTDLLKAFPIAAILGLVWCLVVWRVGTFEDRLFYTMAGVTLLGAAWETRLHPGAWLNTLLPGYCFLTLASTRAARFLDGRVTGLGSALILGQLALLLYNPYQYIPSQTDRAAFETLLRQLRGVPGEVLMLDHGYYPSLAGKHTHAHEMAIRDVLLIDDEWAHRLSGEVRRALAEKHFDLVVQDTPDWFPVPLGRYYRPAGAVFDSAVVLWPPTGNHVRPETLYVPRE